MSTHSKASVPASCTSQQSQRQREEEAPGDADPTTEEGGEAPIRQSTNVVKMEVPTFGRLIPGIKTKVEVLKIVTTTGIINSRN